jgi:hypothetical protein
MLLTFGTQPISKFEDILFWIDLIDVFWRTWIRNVRTMHIVQTIVALYDAQCFVQCDAFMNVAIEHFLHAETILHHGSRMYYATVINAVGTHFANHVFKGLMITIPDDSVQSCFRGQ